MSSFVRNLLLFFGGNAYSASITPPAGTIYTAVSNTFTATTNVPSPVYTWSVGSGATILSGQGTASVVVKFDTAGSRSVSLSVTGGGTASASWSGTVAAFSPVALPGLVLWLDAGDAASLTLDGSNNVSQWNDKSGNARHAVQATVLNRPGYYANQLNGKGAVRGNGTSTHLTNSMPSLAAGYTIASVHDVASTSFSGLFGLYPSSGTGNGLAIWSSVARTGRSGANIALPTSLSTTAGTPISYIAVVDGVNPTSNTTVAGNWNATERTGTATQNTGTPAAGTGYINAIQPTDSNSFANQYELAIYDRALTLTERQLLEAYIVGKWGITWA